MATTKQNGDCYRCCGICDWSYTFLVKDFMPYESSRSVKEKYSNGTGSCIRIGWNVYWR